MLRQCRHVLRPTQKRVGRVQFATVSPSIIAGLPKPPVPTPAIDGLDIDILSKLARSPQNSLHGLIKQYVDHSGKVLDSSLMYESRPSDARRPSLTSNVGGTQCVVMVAHCVQEASSSDYKITLSSGFALQTSQGHADYNDEVLIVTCAHTLEEIRRSPLYLRQSQSPSTSVGNAHNCSATFIVSDDNSGSGPTLHPVSRVVSALPRSDLLLLSCPIASLRTLPVSPYPAPIKTAVRAHFVTHNQPDEPGWTPWVGETWSRWIRGSVLGYRDFVGREAEPGTYDALSHLLFTPPPTAGSSGGPIIDEESGAVVGVMLGSRMDNRVEGLRGYGVPSETIFEMFSLPGLEGKH